jgi:hypothetical protein
VEAGTRSQKVLHAASDQDSSLHHLFPLKEQVQGALETAKLQQQQQDEKKERNEKMVADARAQHNHAANAFGAACEPPPSGRSSSSRSGFGGVDLTPASSGESEYEGDADGPVEDGEEDKEYSLQSPHFGPYIIPPL